MFPLLSDEFTVSPVCKCGTRLSLRFTFDLSDGSIHEVSSGDNTVLTFVRGKFPKGYRCLNCKTRNDLPTVHDMFPEPRFRRVTITKPVLEWEQHLTGKKGRILDLLGGDSYMIRLDGTEDDVYMLDSECEVDYARP